MTTEGRSFYDMVETLDPAPRRNAGTRQDTPSAREQAGKVPEDPFGTGVALARETAEAFRRALEKPTTTGTDA